MRARIAQLSRNAKTLSCRANSAAPDAISFLPRAIEIASELVRKIRNHRRERLLDAVGATEIQAEGLPALKIAVRRRSTQMDLNRLIAGCTRLSIARLLRRRAKEAIISPDRRTPNERERREHEYPASSVHGLISPIISAVHRYRAPLHASGARLRRAMPQAVLEPQE